MDPVQLKVVLTILILLLALMAAWVGYLQVQLVEFHRILKAIGQLTLLTSVDCRRIGKLMGEGDEQLDQAAQAQAREAPAATP